jgi:hypothetical protein
MNGQGYGKAFGELFVFIAVAGALLGAGFVGFIWLLIWLIG